MAAAIEVVGKALVSRWCGAHDVDTRVFNIDLHQYWRSHVHAQLEELPALEHLLYTARIATQLSETLTTSILLSCVEDDCWSNGALQFTRGVCNEDSLSRTLELAMHKMDKMMETYCTSVPGCEAHDDFLGIRQTRRMFGERYLNDVRRLLVSISKSAAVVRPPCQDVIFTLPSMCTQVLKEAVSVSQQHLFWLHASIVNMRASRGFRHALPRPVEIHFDSSIRCFGACAVHGDIAQRVLLEHGRRRPDGYVHAVEIGTYKGHTALSMLEQVHFLHLLMIDPFEEAQSHEDGVHEHKNDYHYSDDAYDLLQVSLAPYRNRSQLIKQHSQIASEWVRDAYFDVVIVDGDHSYRGCSTDTSAWAPKLRGSAFPGVMVFHDYSVEYPGVVRCVHEAVQKYSHNGTLWLGPGFSAWFQAKISF